MLDAKLSGDKSGYEEEKANLKLATAVKQANATPLYSCLCGHAFRYKFVHLARTQDHSADENVMTKATNRVQRRVRASGRSLNVLQQLPALGQQQFDQRKFMV
ncbi:unnamed protein product, partial [Ceratitis capitata]